MLDRIDVKHLQRAASGVVNPPNFGGARVVTTGSCFVDLDTVSTKRAKI